MQTFIHFIFTSELFYDYLFSLEETALHNVTISPQVTSTDQNLLSLKRT